MAAKHKVWAFEHVVRVATPLERSGTRISGALEILLEISPADARLLAADLISCAAQAEKQKMTTNAIVRLVTGGSK